MKRKRMFVLLFSCLLCAMVLPAVAADPLPGESSLETVRISADRLEADDAAHTLVFAGNAVARQGEMSIASDRLTIEYLEGDREVRQITAEGNVEIIQGERVATGQRAVYDRLQQRIVLSGSPMVVDGPNSVSGDEIVLYLDGQRSVVKGGDDGRVQAVFQPDAGDGN